MKEPVSLLPEEVPLIAGAIMYRHDSRLALRELAAQIREVPPMAITTFVAQLLSKRVMIPRQWWVKLVVWVALKRGWRSYDLWKMFLDRHTGTAIDLLFATADHVVSGKDREQPDSVGGCSQREINFIANLLAIVTGAHNAAMEQEASTNEAAE